MRSLATALFFPMHTSLFPAKTARPSAEEFKTNRITRCRSLPLDLSTISRPGLHDDDKQDVDTCQDKSAGQENVQEGEKEPWKERRLSLCSCRDKYGCIREMPFYKEWRREREVGYGFLRELRRKRRARKEVSYPGQYIIIESMCARQHAMSFF